MTAKSAHADRFPALAAGLCQDSGIGFRLGERWSFDPAERTIEVDRQLLDREPHLALGLLAHEASHVWISRYHYFAPRDVPRPVWASFLNALEDPRVNGWMQRRYPGTAPWFRTMYRFDRKAPATTPSRFLAWGLAASVADAYGWKEAVPWLSDRPDVVDALERTAKARRRYALELPPADLTSAMSGRRLEKAYAEEVAPRLAPGTASRATDEAEMVVMLSAARAIEIAAVEILPIVRTLIDEDVRGVASFIEGDMQLSEALDLGLREGRRDVVHDIVDRALRTPERDRGDAEAELSRRAFADYVASRRARSRLGDADADDPAEAESALEDGELPRRRRGRRARPVDARKVDAAVRKQLPALVRDVGAILEPQSRRRSRAGYATGQSIDLRRAMAFEADRRGYDRLWCRREVPHRPKAAVSLLVDLSGSMAGGKIEAATIGTMLLAETLDRLAPGVRYAITGFQDELIPVIAFGEALSAVRRQTILDMRREVYGDRPGGLNRPRYNDDGPCLAEAAATLGHEPGQRILFVVSDGQPAGHRSNGEDLRRVIGRLSEPRADIALFGLGLGRGTDHVKEFYPNAVANIPVEEFAPRIGALLKSVLGRSLRRTGT